MIFLSDCIKKFVVQAWSECTVGLGTNSTGKKTEEREGNISPLFNMSFTYPCKASLAFRLVQYTRHPLGSSASSLNLKEKT